MHPHGRRVVPVNATGRSPCTRLPAAIRTAQGGSIRPESIRPESGHLGSHAHG